MRVHLMVFCLVSCTARGQVEYSVSEEAERGVPVGNVAKDLGIEAATLPLRKPRVISSSSKQYFTIDVSTGALSVNEPVDREQVCDSKPSCVLNYELVLENPLELYKMEFKILDINDNSPGFPAGEHRLNVAEFLSPGARFTLPTAQDFDEGTNSVQSYSLSPNEHFRLEMQTRGDGSEYPELVLEKPLDREQQHTHRLVVTAADGGDPPRSAEAQVTVTVLDTNDNAPAFERSLYRARVLESCPRGTLVTQVRATDLDEGQNAEIRYAFSNSTAAALRGLFLVHPQSGEVTVNGLLEAQRPVLEMFIEARDEGAFGMSSTAKLLVEVTDVNNNAPEVTVTSLSSPLPEDARPGTVIALLRVLDQDPGENGQVTCRIPADIPFQLTPSFDSYYRLVTAGPLDREAASDYNITVTATDLGSPPLAAQQSVWVHISDVNDNPPRFASQAWHVWVPENNQPGASLLQVSASDPDLGGNGRVSYSLRDADVAGGSLAALLSVDSEDGTVYAKSAFDYEQLRTLHFQVEAKDGGSPVLSAASSVSIFIADQNDNAPVILHPGARDGSGPVEVVPRLADVGYLVTKVVAADADSGQNAWLSFQLQHASDAGLFRVLPDTGELRTARALRSTDPAKHRVVVLVRDHGAPPLSSTVALGILLADSLPQALPDFAAGPEPLSSLNLSLIASLAAVSALFLGFLLALLLALLARPYSGCAGCCPAGERKRRLHVRMLPRAPWAPELLEVSGVGRLTHTYVYRAAVGLAPSNNNVLPSGGAAGLAGGHAPAACLQVRKVRSDHFNAVLVVSRAGSAIPRASRGRDRCTWAAPAAAVLSRYQNRPVI